MKTSIQINVRLNHNGETEKSAVIKGFGHVDSGFLAGNILPFGNWKEEEKIFPAICMFTGCPLVAFVDSSMKNPWMAALGAYTGKRSISGPGFQADTLLVCSGLKENHINMDLSIKIHGELPKIRGIKEPFLEVLKKEKEKLLKGVFDFSFYTDTQELPCRAETDYELKDANDVPEEFFRTVTIDTCQQSDGSVFESEQIDMYLKEGDAKKDLKDRVRVSALA